MSVGPRDLGYGLDDDEDTVSKWGRFYLSSNINKCVKMGELWFIDGKVDLKVVKCLTGPNLFAWDDTAPKWTHLVHAQNLYVQVQTSNVCRRTKRKWKPADCSLLKTGSPLRTAGRFARTPRTATTTPTLWGWKWTRQPRSRWTCWRKSWILWPPRLWRKEGSAPLRAWTSSGPWMIWTTKLRYARIK